MRKILKKLIISLWVCIVFLGVIEWNSFTVKAATYPSIMLNGVPYFPQKISSDCGISSISMTEAYALGYDGSYYDAIYEGVFASNGNGLSIGAAVNNGKYTDVSKDLATIYNQLAAGKPVLIYRTGSNKEHWSVIVGYNGSTTTLEKSGFIVYNTAHGQSVGKPYTSNLSTWLSGTTWSHAKVRNKGAINSITTNVSTLTLQNVCYPSNLQTGSGMGSSGLLMSNGNITSVSVGVKTTGGSVKFNASATPNRRYYGLLNLDGSMKFGSLSSGTYIYFVKASDSNGATLNWEQQFTVSSATTSLKKTTVDSSSSGTVSTLPQGCVDSISAGERYVDVSGWAFDRDSVGTSVEIHAYIGQDDNKEFVASFTANGYRPDVGSAYPGVGDYHGFKHRIYTNKTGNQTVYLFAINVGAGNDNPLIGSKTVNILKDATAPSITNYQVTNVTRDGYTVTCVVEDNPGGVGVERVSFPTWSDVNGQDDLSADWYNVCAVYPSGTGNTYTFNVNVANHGYAEGGYTTHIYAYDKAGNYSCVGVLATINRQIPLESFTLSQNQLNVAINQTEQLTVTSYAPSSTTSDKTATWQSSDASVATVDSQGNVTGIKTGYATITCTVAGKTQTCKVNVSEEIIQEFSGWVDSLPTEVANTPNMYEIQQKTQYRYRTKSETTSTTPNLSGWTLSSEWWGDWQPCGADVTGTATREVRQEQQYVKTQYAYNHWHNNSNGATSPVQYSGWVYHETGWIDFALNAAGTSNAGGTKYSSSVSLGACGNKTYWYNQASQDVYNTLYYYRDKYFRYYQWSNWSEWSDNAVSASSNVEVETRTLYRYRYNGVQLLTNPGNQVVEVGETAAFTVSATGTGLTYQWQYSKDDGKTWSTSSVKTASYSTTATAVRDGWLYRCIVTDGNGNSVTSESAKLTVKMPLSVTSQPADVAVEIGATANFKIVASGKGLSYKWQYSKDGGENWSTSSVTSASYSTTATEARNGWLYRCIVTDENGNGVTSNSAKLTVKYPITIITQPANIIVNLESNAIFKIVAEGEKLSYQWQYSKDNGKTWSTSSVKSASYSTAATEARDGWLYRCIVTNDNGYTVTSESAKLTVKYPVSITGQPSDTSVDLGSAVTFKVSATGSGLSYQWQYSKDNGATWTTSSIKSASYSTTATEARDGWLYRCIVTGESGYKVISESAILTVKYPVSISAQPKDVTAEEGNTIEFSVKAIGNSLSYQWQYSKDGGSTWSTSAVKSASYSTTATSARDGWLYRCIVTDGKGNSVTSNTAKLIVKPSLGITSQPANVTANEGDTATFKVAATGNGLSYKWQYSKDGGSTWNTSTVNSATYGTTATAVRNGWLYRCIVTDGSGKSVTSSTARLTVKLSLGITSQPASITVNEGNTATFKVVATGSGLSYQWQYSKDGGSTWSTSTVNSATYGTTATAVRNGWLYRCIVTDGSGNTVTSNTVKLTVKLSLGITSQPASITVNEGNTATFKVVATGSGLSYQWQYSKDGGSTWNTSTVNSATYSTTATAVRNGWLYRCIVVDGSGNSVISQIVSLTVRSVR